MRSRKKIVAGSRSTGTEPTPMHHALAHRRDITHMILVTGAGGKTGVAVLNALVARGAIVRAFVRSNSHREALNAIGVHDIVAGEMDDPRAWSQAAAGTNTGD